MISFSVSGRSCLRGRYTLVALFFSPGQTVLPTPANSSQFFNLARVGYLLATYLARADLNLSKVISPKPSHVFLRLATSANSCQVVLLLLGDCLVVVRQLMVFLLADSTWQYRLATADASSDFATWLEFA